MNPKYPVPAAGGRLRASWKACGLVLLAGFASLPASADTPVQEVRMGAVETGVESRFSVSVPVTSPKQGQVIVDIKTDCDCLRLLTPLPIVVSGSAVPLEFTYTGSDNGHVDVLAVLQSAGEKGLSPLFGIRFTGVVYTKEWVAEASEIIAAGKQSLLVDIRENASIRSKAGIPGSIAMSGFALRAQTASYGGRQIVLIGDNLSDFSALLLVADLKTKNPAMPVRALRGGIAAWKRAGGTIIGTDVRIAFMVSSSEVVMSSALDEWSPLIIGNGHGRIAGRDGIHVAGMGELASTQNELYRRLRGIPKDNLLLITTDDGQHYADMENMLPPDIARRVLYVEGGMNSLRQEMALHGAAARSPIMASSRSSGQGVTRAGSCGGCGKK